VWLAFTHSHPLEHVGSDSQPNHSETHATCFCRNTSSALPHPFRPVAQAVVSLLTRVGRAQERRLKRIRRSLLQKKRELEEANAELMNERDALRKKAKRVADEKATITQKAEATTMELDDTKEALDNAQADLAVTRKQLNNAKNYRKTVAGGKRQAESERDAAREALEQLQTLADERLEAYEELEMEMVMMMMTDDVMAKRKRANGGGGGGGGGDEGDELKEVDIFHEGRYDDNMRVAIFSCMRAGVGKDRIPELVAAILRALAKIKVNRLPSPSTIAKWAGQMSNLTAIQLYDRLTTDPDALKVLAHDGTTMGGKKYGTGRSVALSSNRSCARARAAMCLPSLIVSCSIHVDRKPLKQEDTDPERESLAMFVREQPDGTAVSAMQLAEDAFDDINTLGGAAFPGRRSLSMASISGTLSDHNTTEQKENNLINAKRAQLLAPAAADASSASTSSASSSSAAAAAAADGKQAGAGAFVPIVSMFCWNHK
jgi:hypothetical protein